MKNHSLAVQCWGEEVGDCGQNRRLFKEGLHKSLILSDLI